MPRTKRICPAGEVFHVLNRAVARMTIFELAEQWRWGSAFARRQSTDHPWLATPVDPPLPRQWRAWGNKPQTEAEESAIRDAIRRGAPLGNQQWAASSAIRLGLESTRRPRGRPSKRNKGPDPFFTR